MELEAAGVCRLLATCDPRHREPSLRKGLDLEGRGVCVYDDLESLLAAHADELAFVVVATPIHLHAPMHRQCVEAMVPCYLEKPPTLWWPEFEKMCAVEEQARMASFVGFNFQTERDRRALIERLRGGEFGRIEKVSYTGLCGRNETYFQRSNWAGRLQCEGRPVLDSCVGNAFAHHIVNSLRWAGAAETGPAARIRSLRAWLGRANAIEGTDTVAAEVRTGGGVELRVASTHACARSNFHLELVRCERAVIRTMAHREFEIWRDGQLVEILGPPRENPAVRNLRHYLGSVLEERTPAVTLPDCASFVLFNNLIYISAGQIHPLAWEHGGRTGGNGDVVRIVPGLEEDLLRFAAGGPCPHDAPLGEEAAPAVIGRLGEVWKELSGVPAPALVP